MNSQNQMNTDFLLNVPDEVFDDWLLKMPYDDIIYAIELLQNYLTQKELQQLEQSDSVMNVSDAVSVLNKFVEKKNA